MNSIGRKGGENMSCNHHKDCGCHSKRNSCSSYQSQQNRCHQLGPFIATDSKCIVPKALTGSIIPFSSGTTPSLLVTAVGGLVGTTTAIGFGTAVPGISVVDNTISLLPTLLDETFSVPRTGSITSIAADFRITASLTLTEAATINATVYHAPAGSNIFTATAASVNLAPSLTGVLALNQLVSGTSSNFVPVAVAPGDRLLMVFSVTGPLVATTVTGVASAGINIE